MRGKCVLCHILFSANGNGIQWNLCIINEMSVDMNRMYHIRVTVTTKNVYQVEAKSTTIEVIYRRIYKCLDR